MVKGTTTATTSNQTKANRRSREKENLAKFKLASHVILCQVNGK